MRACFLGQNICALGFGVATLQTPPLLVDERTGEPLRTEAPQKDGDNPPRPQTGVEAPPIAIGPL
jgi:hypothetical protein